jgi:signal transduction histidine kinase
MSHGDASSVAASGGESRVRPALNPTVDDLLNTAPCGFLSFGDDGVVKLANATLLQMLGQEKQQVVGHHLDQLFTVGSRIFYQTHWFPLLRLHGRADEIFLMFKAVDGSDIGCLVNAVRRGHGALAQYDCIIVRVREREKYEGELLRARRTAEQALAEVEARGRELEYANHLLEAQAAELEMQQQQLQEQAMELSARSEKLEHMNAELLARSHEAEVLRRAAEEASAAKSTFLAVMSHELRTPLNAVLGYAQLIALGVRGPVNEDQVELLSRIERSGHHLLRLINEVLNLARIESGVVEYTLSNLDVRTVLADTIRMVEPQVAQKRITVIRDLESGLHAHADAEKTEQILLNLLGNAAKFTPEGGRIELSASTGSAASSISNLVASDCVVISVADTGPGIPDDMQERVFEPFVQVDASRTRKAEGSGLGLAISRNLARGMGGDIILRSAAGMGSTFYLVLPAGIES